MVLSEDVTMNVISHECFHVVDGILSARDIHLLSGTEEVYAYLLGYVVDEVYSVWQKMINRV